MSVPKYFAVSRLAFDTSRKIQAVAYRYTPTSQFKDESTSPEPAVAPDSPGYVLTFVHAAEFPKALWEPVISRLFELQVDMQYASIATGVPMPTPVKEIWTLEYHSDGDAPKFDTPDYANILATFRQEILGGSLKSNYSEADRFVLVAHSVGCSEALLSTSLLSMPSVLKSTFYSIILAEPLLGLDPERQLATAKLFIETSSAYIERPKAEGAYKRSTSVAKSASSQLDQIGPIIPVHAIMGSIDDVISRDDKVFLEQGRTIASISKVEGVGHWIPQSSPQKMAEVVFNILQQSGLQFIRKSSNTSSKL